MEWAVWSFQQRYERWKESFQLAAWPPAYKAYKEANPEYLTENPEVETTKAKVTKEFFNVLQKAKTKDDSSSEEEKDSKESKVIQTYIAELDAVE